MAFYFFRHKALLFLPIIAALLSTFIYSEEAVEQEQFIYSSKPSAIGKTLGLNPMDWKQDAKRLDKNLSFWYRDHIKQNLKEQHFFQFDSVLVMGKTKFQDYALINSKQHGKMLVIDGEVQSSLSDEHVYHETLVQPAMTAHACPKSVLIIGAGEGAAAREVLRHPSVERIVLVDIDDEIIQKSVELLKEWHQGSFHHPKVELLIVDGNDYVKKTSEKFDIVYIDICDNLDNTPAAELYTERFYSSLKRILNPRGIVVIQAMEFNAKKGDNLTIHTTVKKIFQHVAPYRTYVPCLCTEWGFIIGSDFDYFSEVNSSSINATLDERGVSPQLRHYDEKTHLHMFSLSKEERERFS